MFFLDRWGIGVFGFFWLMLFGWFDSFIRCNFWFDCVIRFLVWFFFRNVGGG